MCHSVLFGLLLGVLAGRLLWRLRWARHGGCGYGGGGCGGGARYGGLRERWEGGRWRVGFRGGPFGADAAEAAEATRAAAAHRPAAELIAGLELNTRQSEEAGRVLALLTEQLGERGRQVSAALRAVASEPFDRIGAEEALTAVAPTLRRELIDGLEHVHTILIPEQREQLRKALASPPSA